MQKPGFCRKLLDRHCLKKTGFLKICATEGSLGISRLPAYPFFKIGSKGAAKIGPSSSRCRVRNSTLTHQNRTVFKANNSVLSRFGQEIDRRYDLLQLSPFRAKRSLILLQLPQISNYIFHLHWLPRIVPQFKHRKPENFPTA